MLVINLTALALVATALTAAGCGSSKSDSTTTSAATTTPASSVATTTASTEATTPVTPPAHLVTVTVKAATGTPLSHAAWVAKANAACARLNGELERVHVSAASEIPRILPQTSAYERHEVAQLAKLVPPASGAHDWQQLLDASLQRAEDTAKIVSEVKAGSSPLSTPLALAVRELEERIDRIAAHAGLRACAQA